MQIEEVKGWGKLRRILAKVLAGTRLNIYEGKVVWAIVFKTVAFNKKEDEIPWSQLSELTGIDEWNLTRPINSLLKRGIIFRRGSVLGVQLDFKKWKIPSIEMVEKESPSLEKESPSLEKESPSLEMDSRELLKRASQERGLSASKDKKRGKKQLEIIRKARMEFERILKEKKKQ